MACPLISLIRTPHGCVDWNASLLVKQGVPIFAPHTGAWIETIALTEILGKAVRTPHGCVDWNTAACAHAQSWVFAPHTGAWIETIPSNKIIARNIRTPHGCVDWNSAPYFCVSDSRFAPHTGAWIETRPTSAVMILACSHPTRVRGLKPQQCDYWHYLFFRTPHGCVDWNALSLAAAQAVLFAPHTGAWIETTKTRGSKKSVVFAPHTGAWIETKVRRLERASNRIRTPHGCVDWNQCQRLSFALLTFAPHTGAWIETVDSSTIVKTVI